MSLVELNCRGTLKYVISQNCDGLHRRSGLPASAISELHGNGNIEICEDCGSGYFRDFKCQRMLKGYDHFTGRFCRCGGRLLNSTIDFGQNLHSQPLRLAREHSTKADLHFVLGSSLTVSPACDMPTTTAKMRGNLVICNLQKTPLTDMADFQIYAETDVVMKMLMEELEVPVPPFRLIRRLVAQVSVDTRTVSLKAVDLHNPSQEMGIIREVDWHGSGMSNVAAKQSASLIAARLEAHDCPVSSLNLGSVKPVVYFVGHYHEPPYQLDLDLEKNCALDVLLSFDPYELVWQCVSLTSIGLDSLKAEPQIDGEYGKDHRDYCINQWVKKHGKSRAQATQKVAAQVEQSKTTAIAANTALQPKRNSSQPRRR